jgi:hypothetical protein
MNGNVPNRERTVPRGRSWGSCADCVHLGPQMTCPAFPDRIPQLSFADLKRVHGAMEIAANIVSFEQGATTERDRATV